ncbi:6493_t:CDS:2, partial [Dentiscutata heterogama]
SWLEPINSTQWVESLNRKIHDHVQSNSSLLILTKEIQDLLDKESEYVRIEEYKKQIPTIGLPTIAKTYFNSIEKVVLQYLLPVMSAQEDNYKVTKIYLADIISTISLNQIVEIWRVVISCGSKNNYVILLADGSHRCIYNMIITHGFFEGNNVWQQSPITIYVNSNQNQSDIEYPVSKFDYLKQIRSIEVYNPMLKDINNTRQMYGRAQGVMRKAIDIAIATSSYDELMGICYRFIMDKKEKQESDTMMNDIEYDIRNPVISKQRGRPPGRAISCVKIQDQRPEKRQHLQISEIIERHETQEKDTRKTCKICRNKRHNRATCKLDDN